MTPPRHTLGFLRQRFRELGFRPEARYGQNFLIDQNLLDILIDAAELTTDDVVLEVGTGTGALTGRLASRAGHVVTVEIDSRMRQFAAEELQEYDNLTMLGVDALKNKNTIQPIVLETIDAQCSAREVRRPWKLVANLPYHIATPLISNLLLVPVPPARMVITIQKELADRLLASPSTKDYGSLSVWMQAFCDIELLRVLAPTVFWPRPKVESAMVLLKPRFDQLAAQQDLHAFHRFVRAIFLLRRKYLRGVLLTLVKHDMEKPELDAVLSSLAIDPRSRAEELTMEQLEELFRSFQARLQARGGSF